MTSRECKLFSLLLHYLKGRSASAMLNSRGEVDIEFMGWSAVPQAVKEQAIRIGADFQNQAAADCLDQTILGWKIEFRLVRFADLPATWCVISASSAEHTCLRDIAHEDARPIFVDQQA
jgi:hypothetical protein